MKHIIYENQRLIKTLGLPLRDQARAMELRVAEAVAYGLSIPSSAVESTTNYYILHNKVKVLEQLAQINEECVIDMDATNRLVYEMWRLRYCLVHCPNDPFVGRILANCVAEDRNKIAGGYTKLLEDYPSLLSGFTTVVSEDAPNE